MSTSIRRQYTNLAGIDLKNDESLVNLNRSPDALNIYKDYTTEGNCIQTRPGYIKLAEFDAKINGMYIYNSSKALIHSGTKLYLWNNFPTEPREENLITLSETMNNDRTSFFVFNSKVYIKDGVNYLVYDGNLLKQVSTEAFIPTTTINRNPAGGGILYQDINLLQTKRINSFYADGTSTEYYLDTTEIDSIDEVYVNDMLVTEYSSSLLLGKITFNTAPQKPVIDGKDNVKIVFSKSTAGYIDRIAKCKIAQVFDNRVFFTGNLDYPNAIFHSEIQNPAYISDLSYYQDGTSESAIKSITVGNNILWVFKEQNQENATVFYHIPTTSKEYGRIYPSKQGNVSIGCYSTSINFSDDIVFLSKYGLEGITGNIEEEQLLTHRSSLIDNKLININNYNNAQMTEWQGYLLILCDGYIFLADSRQKFQEMSAIEYEWYLWDIKNSNPNILKEYKGDLYIGSSDGSIYIFGGTNDNGEILNAYWTTVMDSFGYSNLLKTTNKRGGVAKIKTIPNGQIKISERTNKKDEKYITSKSATGFDYNNIDYNNFEYTTKNESYIVYKIKEKKFLNISLRFYTDELDKPFGLYSAILEAFIGGYVKR